MENGVKKEKVLLDSVPVEWEDKKEEPFNSV